MNDPIDRIEWVQADSLVANLWNPNAIQAQELALLEWSILKTGWIQPVLINADRVIIDGFHRWALALRSPRLREQYQGCVPVAVVPVSLPEAMMMTIRINRAKGTHVAVRMSEIVHALIGEHGLDVQQIAQNIGANRDEVELLAQDGVFQARGLDKLPFSRAWVPKDTPRPKISRRDSLIGPHFVAPSSGNGRTPGAVGGRSK